MPKLHLVSVLAVVIGVTAAIASRNTEKFNVAEKPARVALEARVTIGGDVMASGRVVVTQSNGTIVAVGRVDERGHLRTFVPPGPGTYSLGFASDSADPPMALVSTSREVTVSESATAVDVDLPATRVPVKVRVPAELKPELVQLALFGPAAPTGYLRVGLTTRQNSYAAEYVGIGYGEYRLVAFSSADVKPKLVSRSPVVFRLSPTSPVTQPLEVDLIQRVLEIEVRDQVGTAGPVEVSALHRTLPVLANRRFDGSGIPPGVELLVVSRRGTPVCALAASDATQVIDIQPRQEHAVRLVLVNAPSRPLGLIAGLPGSQCAVPISAFPLEWRGPDEAGRMTIDIRGLPKGAYSFQADERSPSVSIAVPGDSVTYNVPPGCKVCGAG